MGRAVGLAGAMVEPNTFPGSAAADQSRSSPIFLRRMERGGIEKEVFVSEGRIFESGLGIDLQPNRIGQEVTSSGFHTGRVEERTVASVDEGVMNMLADRVEDLAETLRVLAGLA